MKVPPQFNHRSRTRGQPGAAPCFAWQPDSENHLPTRASQALAAEQHTLAAAVVNRLADRQPGSRTGDSPLTLKDRQTEVRRLIACLHSTMAFEAPALFHDYLAWAKCARAQRAPGWPLVDQLEMLREVVALRLPGQCGEAVTRYVNDGLQRWPHLPEESSSQLDETSLRPDTARQYLCLLLAGQRHHAGQFIQEMIEQGVSVADLYQQVFQPAQFELGRLWQTGEITAAQEHFTTAATQGIMAQLYRYVSGVAKRHGTLVATCAPGEFHDLGLRMVSDLCEQDGWVTYYLGANTPFAAIVATLKQRRAGLLAISASLSANVPAVAALIQAVRDSDAGDTVRILVGGHPFGLAPDLWRAVGADGCAPDAGAALAVANQFEEAGGFAK